MASLFTSLLNSSGALAAYSQALQTVSNDVTNASTPGYVKQTATLIALPFDPSVGLPGGVGVGHAQSSRNAFAEQNVRNRQSSAGFYQQQAADLGSLSNLFDLSGKTGIAPALSNLFNSFSQLSISPNDATARQNVLNQAGQAAQTFHHAAAGLADASQQTARETTATVDAVNRLASALAHLNAAPPSEKGKIDPGIDAQLNSTLEELSKYANFTALQQPDGTVNVYLGGQTPVVLGDQAQAVQADFSTGQARLLDNQGRDITAQISQGQLAGLLDVYNNKIPSYHTGLNSLAKNLADQVNTALSNGIDANGAAPAAGLFTYNANGGEAATLAVNSALTPDQIAAALPGAPGGNGNALALSNLGQAKTVNGYTFTQFFGNLGGRVGQDIADAQSGHDAQTQALTQAQALRSQVSSVSLDEEAERLIQFQRGYQAASKLVTVLDDLTNTVISMIR